MLTYFNEIRMYNTTGREKMEIDDYHVLQKSSLRILLSAVTDHLMGHTANHHADIWFEDFNYSQSQVLKCPY